MELKVKLKRANSSGTGLFELPKNIEPPSSFVSVEILDINKEFKARIRLYGGKPIVYVPRRVAKDLDGNFIIRITQLDGNYAKIGSDGRIYLKKELISKYNIRPKSIIKIITKDFSKFVTVNYRKRKHKEEYTCMLDLKLAHEIVRFEIENNNEKPTGNAGIFLPKARIKYIRDKAIISINNARNIAIALSIPLDKYAHYLGAYFADGTKKGNSWALCASSTAQATYYLKNHSSIVLEPRFNFIITYTNFNESDSEIKKKTRSYWREMPEPKLRIIKSKGKNPSKKTNRFGTLVIKENSRTIVKLYNALLSEFFKLVKKSKNKELARMFIMGILEGDGSVSSLGHGHLMITTNSAEVKLLKPLLDISDLDYNINTKKNRASIRINALSILENLCELEPYIFKYYPDRRRLFCQRFCNNIGVCRFLLGKQNYASGWVKSKLNKKRILTGFPYRPTALGKRIVDSLKKLDCEIHPTTENHIPSVTVE